MDVIRESAEHHFITTLDRLKKTPNQWSVFHFELSKDLNHASLMTNYQSIPQKISAANARAEKLLDIASKDTKTITDGYIYIFSDKDIIILAKENTDNDKATLRTLYHKIRDILPKGYISHKKLETDMYSLQNFADKKLLTVRRFEAYHNMMDTNKVGSISARRSRRDSPVVMFVEDDRFTSAYASNILGKDYDLVLCKNGEEAILEYIEYAPDVVFLDIHLPGLNGHDTLQAIRAIDDSAYCVMLSVDTQHNNIIKASQNGAHKFLKKPFSRERLIETVKASPYVRSLIHSMRTN